jgi:hypothetical protein
LEKLRDPKAEHAGCSHWHVPDGLHQTTKATRIAIPNFIFDFFSLQIFFSIFIDFVRFPNWN